MAGKPGMQQLPIAAAEARRLQQLKRLQGRVKQKECESCYVTCYVSIGMPTGENKVQSMIPGCSTKL
jgi:hypothetical protein